MRASWIYPFIILGGVLQTCGAAMNAQLFHSLENRWLASAVSFALITAFFLCLFAMFPSPLPTARGLAEMPWWAALGGLVGAVQVYGGLTLVNKVGAGPFVEGVRRVDLVSVLAALGITALTTIVSAWRWRLIARGLGLEIPLGNAVSSYYRSQFLNSMLPGGVLGDVHRGVRQGQDSRQKAGGQGISLGSTCVLSGMPKMMNFSEPMEIVIRPKITYFIPMQVPTRRIHTDGRDWPANEPPTFVGTGFT